MSELRAGNRGRIRAEVLIVLALSLGASAVYSVVAIVERVTREAALSDQTATINRSLAERAGFDLVYQLLAVLFGLAPVALVVFLTWRQGTPRMGRLGLGPINNASTDNASMLRRWSRETLGGIALAAAIGIPGVVFYVATKLLGMNTTVVPTALDAYWWTIPVLILQALRAALTEEIIVVAYLFDRLRALSWSPLAIILGSALLRGTYHLYQGFGGFLGNIIMGLVFGYVYHRWGRALPLIVAHWALDVVSFVGYPLALALWPQWFGL